MEPLTWAALVFGTAGFLLGLYELRRRERLLARIRPWERHASTLAKMGEEHLRNVDNLRFPGEEAQRTVRDMADSARKLAESMRQAGVRFRGPGDE